MIHAMLRGAISLRGVESKGNQHGETMKLVRRTAYGALVGGGAFTVVTVFRSITSGGPFLDSLNPILLFALIGATVGGLVGPLIGAAIEGFRSGPS